MNLLGRDLFGTVTYYRDVKRNWRWRLRAPNGNVLADSGEGYLQRAKCLTGWRSFVGLVGKLAGMLPGDVVFHAAFYTDKAGDQRWRLKAANGNIVADGGQGYSSRRRAAEGLLAAARWAPRAVAVVV